MKTNGCARYSAKGVPFTRLMGGCGVGIILLVALACKTNLHLVIATIAGMSLWSLAATILVIYLSIPLRAVQWRLLLGEAREVSFRRVLKVLSLGYLGNALFPAGGGELTKAYILSRLAGISMANVLATVFIVRVQDLMPVGMLAVLALGIVSPWSGAQQNIPQEAIRTAVWAFVLASMAIVLGLAGFYAFRKRLVAVMTLLVRHFSAGLAYRAISMVDRFTQGLAVLGNMRRLWLSQLCAAGCWILFAAAPIPLLLNCHLNLGQAALTAVAMTGVVTLAQLLPLTPGALGTYHVLCVLILLAMNPSMSRDAAFGYALVSHLIGTFGPAIPGVILAPSAWGQLRAIRNAQSVPDTQDSTRAAIVAPGCEPREQPSNP